MDRTEAIAREALSVGDLARIQSSHGGLEPSEVTLDLAQAVAGGVWGQGFPAPTFDDVFAVTDQRTVAGKHSKLVLERSAGGASLRFAAILFNHADPLPASIRAVYRPDANDWNGTIALQLVIEHWEPVRAGHA